MKFLVKWLLNGAIVSLLLLYYAEIPLLTGIAAATVLTVVAYFLGDQLILRSTNNAIATFADAVLAIVYLWAAAYWMNWNLNLGEILVITAILGIAEWFLHRYVFNDSRFMRKTAA
ncbi:DUF2512 family protein [Cohnella sp. CFH 77786]|uniref:DUF2512 family protein n=1 Tax=Cohnella sp. CFH 77786 TaxID=2662265 RepID=UPI001C60979B|nr:DUF2512 family protein [Cohnella sp. CFH 77786]